MNDNYTIESMNWRYACKKFDGRNIPNENLNTILEAARLAPSSLGLELSNVISISSPEIKNLLIPHSFNNADRINTSSHLLVLCRNRSIGSKELEDYKNMVISARPDTSKEDIDTILNFVNSYINSRDEDSISCWLSNQVYIILGVILSTCATIKIDSCPMEGIDTEAYDKILGLENTSFTSVVAIAIGYRSKDDSNQYLAKARKSLKEYIVHK